MKKLIFVALLIFSMAALAACGGGTSGGAVPGEDYIVDEPMPSGAEDARKIELDFTPETIKPNEVTMKAGEKILFVIANTDEEEEHNFLDPNAELKEILVHPGQTVRRLWTAPTEPGVYEPNCAIHPWIRMTFIVE